MDTKEIFPFTQIVGQEKMKKALLLNIVDPSIGGVLIRGEKGTAKSTAVRSLEQILPHILVVDGCSFNCNPEYPRKMCTECYEKYTKGVELKKVTTRMKVVELPLSATEDRVSGTLDLEHILKIGEKRFEPGVLARANENLLYIDEINLLDDHIVDILLDSAAMGRNYVEREGVSFSHPSRFILVGTMNPEEGEMRPQLLDRFGLSVDVKGESNFKIRSEIISRRLKFDSDPDMYLEEFSEESERLRKIIISARNIIKDVQISNQLIEVAAKISIVFGLDGHRADITLIRAARANAAFEGRHEVTKKDLKEIAILVLLHRLKRRPFEEAIFDTEELERCLAGF